MPDCRPGHGTPVDVEKMRTLTVGRRTRPTVREGRQHPESGGSWKATTDELGATVTEHARGDRQDVLIRPQTAHRVRTSEETT